MKFRSKVLAIVCTCIFGIILLQIFIPLYFGTKDIKWIFIFLVFLLLIITFGKWFYKQLYKSYVRTPEHQKIYEDNIKLQIEVKKQLDEIYKEKNK